MNKAVKYFLVVFCIVILASCATPFEASYQMESRNTGTLKLIPSKATEATYVTLNGNLVVEKKNVTRVTLRNVPAGNHTIHYTCQDTWYESPVDLQFEVQVPAGGEETELITIPPYNGAWRAIQVVSVVASSLTLLLLVL